ncbi:helix-turn-helix domain-containing protein [Solihabitans fulvus]|uniref:Helix-turn-helix domain-containing protein n=1 Tax=Solihabitans fulvus TaxID=1892852 RepID=A0A5B2XE14_9PSEU|nr:helix-turn-helix transcriptional regulator [Solihabitans fulvus]KAA2261289.1 helix-turn-helix domain-containing protein [Solihabitans fulvus]
MGRQHVFGVELRRLRVDSGISLGTLAKQLHYSKGYLSKIETGARRPTMKLARQADASLGANGTLAALVSPIDQPTGRPGSTIEEAAPTATNLFHETDVLALGDAMSLPLGLPAAEAEAAAEDPGTEQHFREQFERCRDRGQRHAPGFVLRELVMELATLLELIKAARQPESRIRLSLLGARYAEYAGWMAQEAGQHESARTWTRRSATMAAGASDSRLAAYALVREAELAMYECDAARTVALADKAARHPGADSRIRGLASHRRAQGYALLGDHDRCYAALDHAGVLLSERTPSGPGGPVLGSSAVTELNLAVSGWCLYDLGQPKRAAESLEYVLSRTPAARLRVRALYGARLALAYEAAGELGQMCRIGFDVLTNARPIGSAIVRAELRDLARILVRHHGYGPVRELHAEINAALHRSR